MTGQVYITSGITGNEIFPTPVRNLGFSFCQVWNRFGVVLSPFVFYLVSIREMESENAGGLLGGSSLRRNAAHVCGGRSWLSNSVTRNEGPPLARPHASPFPEKKQEPTLDLLQGLGGARPPRRSLLSSVVSISSRCSLSLLLLQAINRSLRGFSRLLPHALSAISRYQLARGGGERQKRLHSQHLLERVANRLRKGKSVDSSAYQRVVFARSKQRTSHVRRAAGR